MSKGERQDVIKASRADSFPTNQKGHMFVAPMMQHMSQQLFRELSIKSRRKEKVTTEALGMCPAYATFALFGEERDVPPKHVQERKGMELIIFGGGRKDLREAMTAFYGDVVVAQDVRVKSLGLVTANLDLVMRDPQDRLQVVMIKQVPYYGFFDRLKKEIKDPESTLVGIAKRQLLLNMYALSSSKEYKDEELAAGSIVFQCIRSSNTYLNLSLLEVEPISWDEEAKRYARSYYTKWRGYVDRETVPVITIKDEEICNHCPYQTVCSGVRQTTFVSREESIVLAGPLHGFHGGVRSKENIKETQEARPIEEEAQILEEEGGAIYEAPYCADCGQALDVDREEEKFRILSCSNCGATAEQKKASV